MSSDATERAALLTELNALRRGVVAGLGLAWDSGAHGGMTPTDDEIVQWVAEDHEKLLRIYEGHHKRGGARGRCPDCGMVGNPKQGTRSEDQEWAETTMPAAVEAWDATEKNSTSVAPAHE